MREIKFRAFDLSTKEMKQVEFLYPYEKEDEDWNLWEVSFKWEKTTKYFWNWSLKQVELMQYTGLKDKNWKEIYEGDIIQVWSLNWIVKYVAWKYVIVDKKDLHITDLYNSWHLFNIIGNAYKNPELLNK